MDTFKRLGRVGSRISFGKFDNITRRPRQGRYFGPSITEKPLHAGLRTEKRYNLIETAISAVTQIRAPTSDRMDFFLQAVTLCGGAIDDVTFQVGTSSNGTTLSDQNIFAILKGRAQVFSHGGAITTRVQAWNIHIVLPTPVRIASTDYIVVTDTDLPSNDVVSVLLYGWLEPSLF